jgi:hypothetical protein
MVVGVVHSACRVDLSHLDSGALHSESFWTHPMVLLGDVGQVEACFGLFRDSVHLGAR